MTSVAVAGASGYAGGELIRILSAHPGFDLRTIAAGSNAGERLDSVHPQFSSVAELGSRLFSDTTAAELSAVDFVFLALPHGHSAQLVSEFPDSVAVVDLGADFRLRNSADWDMFYGGTHAGTWTYGLPEIRGQRDAISSSRRVANPGCYATAISLGLAPLVANGLIELNDIVVTAASGTSGAGRGAKVNLLASEVAGAMSAYKVGGNHQHTPEVEQTLSDLGAGEVSISFTPMLAPMSRGILASISARTSHSLVAVREALHSWYDAELFVTVLPDGQLPNTAATLGSNAAHIQVVKDERTSRATILVALDNLIKGAAGQAVQNANLMSGFAQDSGLSRIGVAP